MFQAPCTGGEAQRPSVAMWMAPGSIASISSAIFRPAPTASRISGYVGMRYGAEAVGADDFHGVTELDKLIADGREGSDDAVDLRVPGVRYDQDLHAAALAGIKRREAAQSTIRSSPLASSIRAVQDSTQSPSLQ